MEYWDIWISGKNKNMPIDLKHALLMLEEKDCPFTLQDLEERKKDNSKPLFTWSGIDMYLIINVEAKTK